MSQVAAEKEMVEELRRKQEETKNKVSSEGAQEKASIEESYLRKIDTLK